MQQHKKRKVQQIINKLCGPVPKTRGSKNTAPGLEVNTKTSSYNIISRKKCRWQKEIIYIQNSQYIISTRFLFVVPLNKMYGKKMYDL